MLSKRDSQGDVDGLLECSLALGINLPRIGVDDPSCAHTPCRTDIAHTHGSRCLQCLGHVSPFSCFIPRPCCSRTVTLRSHCRLHCPRRNVPDPKARIKRTSERAPRSLATWPIPTYSTLQKRIACKQNTQPRCREFPLFSWVDLRNSPEQTTHITPCKKNGGLADLWCMDDRDILCHPVLVPSYLHEIDDANDKSGSRAQSSKKKKKQRSSTTSQTWTQPRLNGKLTRCESWLQWPLEAPRLELLWDLGSSSRTNS